MKPVFRLSLTLALALLMLLGAACGTKSPEAHTKIISPETVDLIGTWVAVDGEGMDYSIDAMKRKSITIYRNYKDDETELLYYEQLFSSGSFGHVALGEDGSVIFRELKAENEAKKTYLTFDYSFDDAKSCHENVYNLFVKYNFRLDGQELSVMDGYYEQNIKDMLVLHYTGYKQDSPVQKTPIDTTLKLEKALPIMLGDHDTLNFAGVWNDNVGNKWIFTVEDEPYHKMKLKMISADGEAFTDTFSSMYLDLNENGEPMLAYQFTMNPVNKKSGRFYIKVTDLIFKGNEIVIKTDSEELVLKPEG